jgi:hypothetical protein
MASVLARPYLRYVYGYQSLQRFVITLCFNEIQLIMLQIGHVTCDNATNNNTMMNEFAKQYEGQVGKVFDVKGGHIR